MGGDPETHLIEGESGLVNGSPAHIMFSWGLINELSSFEAIQMALSKQKESRSEIRSRDLFTKTS